MSDLHPALVFGPRGLVVFCTPECRETFEEKASDLMRFERLSTDRTQGTDRFGNPDWHGERCSTCGASLVAEEAPA